MNALRESVERISKISGVPVDEIEMWINQVCAVGEVREIEYKRLVYYAMEDKFIYIGMNAPDFKEWVRNKWN